MSWQPNQYNPQAQWQPPPASGYAGQPPSYRPPPPQGSYYQGPPPATGAPAAGGYYYGAPPTSSVGPGGAAAYQPPPPTSTYQSYPPPARGPPPPGPGGPYGGPPPPAGPPAGIDPELWTWFQAVDDDKSGRITAKELRQALLNSNWSHFNAETCRLLIGMFDSNHDGTIDISEFAALWKYVQEWRQCFDKFDKDGSGNIDADELRQALESFGYRLSMGFCTLCTRVFDRLDKNTMKFDDFIQCCVMLKSLTESFKRLDTNRSGVITINYETFLEMAIDNTIQ